MAAADDDEVWSETTTASAMNYEWTMMERRTSVPERNDTMRTRTKPVETVDKIIHRLRRATFRFNSNDVSTQYFNRSVDNDSGATTDCPLDDTTRRSKYGDSNLSECECRPTRLLRNAGLLAAGRQHRPTLFHRAAIKYHHTPPACYRFWPKQTAKPSPLPMIGLSGL